jgi:hypothetical protein
MTKAHKWCLAYLTNRIPPEFLGKPVEEPSCGEIVSFIKGLPAETARKYASDYQSGATFKQRVEAAFREYQIETAVEPEKVKLPRLQNKTGGPLTYKDAMSLSSSEYMSLVYDDDGKPRIGVRESLAEIIAEGRRQHKS